MAACQAARQETRTDHLRLVTGYLSWKLAGSDGPAAKELEEFLLGRAMEHDSPTPLFTWRVSTWSRRAESARVW